MRLQQAHVYPSNGIRIRNGKLLHLALTNKEHYKEFLSLIVPLILVDGGWSGWGDWGKCDKSCFKTRIRKCNRPTPSNNGRQCIGPPTERFRCSFDECMGE